MLNEKAYIHDEKARLHERLPELARDIGGRSGSPDVQLDSFIVSATSYEDLRKRYDNGKMEQGTVSQTNTSCSLSVTLNTDYLERILRS